MYPWAGKLLSRMMILDLLMNFTLKTVILRGKKKKKKKLNSVTTRLEIIAVQDFFRPGKKKKRT